MSIRRIVVRMRHIRHVTRLTHEREACGKSPYVTREVRFRHMGSAK